MMGLDREACHFGKFTAQQCEDAVWYIDTVLTGSQVQYEKEIIVEPPKLSKGQRQRRNKALKKQLAADAEIRAVAQQERNWSATELSSLETSDEPDEDLEDFLSTFDPFSEALQEALEERRQAI